MPVLTHPLWNEQAGSCEFHGPTVFPCQKCLEEMNANICVYLTQDDYRKLRDDPDMTKEGLFPEEQEWLAEQIAGDADSL